MFTPAALPLYLQFFRGSEQAARSPRPSLEASAPSCPLRWPPKPVVLAPGVSAGEQQPPSSRSKPRPEGQGCRRRRDPPPHFHLASLS